MAQTPNLVNDVSGLNPVPVWAVVTPHNTDEVVDALRRSDGPVSIRRNLLLAFVKDAV